MALLLPLFVGCDLTVDESTSEDSTTGTTADVTTSTPPEPDNGEGGDSGGLGGGIELPDDPL